MELGASFRAARGGLLSYYTHRSLGVFILRRMYSRRETQNCPPET